MSEVNWKNAPAGIKEITGSTEGVNGFKPDVLKAARELAIPGVIHDENSASYAPANSGKGRQI